MKKEVFKQFPMFETKRLLIRPFSLKDYDEYIKWYSGDVVHFMEGLHYIKPGDIDAFKRLYLKNAPLLYKKKIAAIWCVADKIDKTIGKIEVCKYDFSAETAQIHYCLSREERGKGIMTEAIQKVLDWCFNILDVNRIYTFVNETNINSAKVLNRCGFFLEGVMREGSANKYTIDGIKIDDTENNNDFLEYKHKHNVCVYGLLKKDYKENLTTAST